MDYERKVTEYLTPSEILAQMAEEGAELVQAADQKDGETHD